MEKFLADESVDFQIVTHLRENGYEIEAIVEMSPGISDEEVLKIANNLEAILFTEDKDFGELTYRFQHPNQGIILIRMGNLELEEKLERIQTLLQDHLEELRNRFTVITQNKIRIKDMG